ncbi:MAG: indole-3-glycerol phosphate synthase TrpC [Lentisphaerae bacterium]|nr:indole-3-glycerol phosphate synthase TrpC [Lentisphaerota bacterium]
MPQKIPDILQKIVETKKKEVVFSRRNIKGFRAKINEIPPALDFKNAISGEKLSVIAEIKKASPSAGIISENFNPLKIATAYRNGGADAVSILTDGTYFNGNIGIIPLVRETLKNIPILRKDFIIDPSQIFEARAYGADSFLLIAGILADSQMQDFIALGRSLGMEPLVEVHSEEELSKSLQAGAEIIGVNNRDLRSFEVSIQISEKLIPLIPPHITAVSESGIKCAKDTEHLFFLGFNAVLVGEALMRSGVENCGRIISEFKKYDGFVRNPKE